MRLGPVPNPRCAYAIKFGTTLHTRCMGKPGHNGPHQGKGLRKFPYQRISWYHGDAREYITERNDEFAFSPRKEHVDG